MIRIKDNFLPDIFFNKIYNLFFDDNIVFPWYLNTNVTNKKNDRDFFFGHHIFNYENGITSQYYDNFFPIVYFIQDKLDIKIKDILRMKANLYTNQGKQINHQRHIDIQDLNHIVAIYCVNDNNGFTMVGDKKVISKANRIIVFDGSIEHCSNTQTDTAARININMDLI